MMPVKHAQNFRKNFFEQQAWQDHQVVCGVDEVGRGCLAGPVVTAAVILPAYAQYILLKDSKVLSPAERLLAARWIKKHCIYGIGIIHHRLIDHKNIWHATLLAMKKALVHVLSIAPERPASIVVDAMPLDLWDTSYATIPVHYFVKGESKSSSIAAASILAKVTRDELMHNFALIFPDYSLQQHKGYATLAHKKALKAHSYTIIHRKTFECVKVVMQGEQDEYAEQQTICRSY